MISYCNFQQDLGAVMRETIVHYLATYGLYWNLHRLVMIDNSRIYWGDIVKALAIILVVWNHSATGITDYELPYFISGATEFFHLFNLSSFFLVAGLFVCSSVKKPTGQYLWNLFCSVYYPMVLWSILQGTIYALGSAHVSKPTPLWEPLLTSWYHPHKQMSFLLSLLAGRVLFLVADRLRLPWWGITLMTIAGIGLYGQMWEDPPQTFIAPDSVLWMCLGAGITALGGPILINRSRASIFLILLIISATTAVAIYNFWPRPLTASYYSLTLIRAFGMASVVLLSIFLSKLGPMRLLTFIGQNSLPIFLAHLIFVGPLRITLTKFVGLDNPTMIAVICFIFGIVMPLVLYRIFGNRWLFRLPLPYPFHHTPRSMASMSSKQTAPD